jgi:hypothetical protein
LEFGFRERGISGQHNTHGKYNQNDLGCPLHSLQHDILPLSYFEIPVIGLDAYIPTVINSPPFSIPDIPAW